MAIMATMARGSFFKKAASAALAAGLFLCCALSVYADKSDYADIDRLYSRKGDESIYISEGKFLYNFKGDYPGVTICGYAGDSKTLNIPNMINGRDVAAIEKDAFAGNKRIEKVTFPNSVKSIGNNCFNGCPNLKEVSLATGVSTFEKVFCDCPKLKSITFPQGVSSIQDSFKNCTSLSYVKFARSVTSIGEQSFSGCISLTQIDWMGGIVKLGNAFDGCTALESLSFPEGLVLIDGAFGGCTALREISFPQTLLYITGGFTGCSSLTKIELPEKALFVNEAFNDCENLSKLRHSDATSISDTAFKRCPKLVIEKENHFMSRLLKWTALVAIMALAGFLTFRLLTFMAKNLTQKKNMTSGKDR